MMDDNKDRRKNYYIKKNFQKNFILKFCAIVLMGSILSGAIIYFMSTATVTTSFENIRLVIKSTADYILPSVLLSGALVVVVTVIATVFVTLFASHKIAGPLYRIEKDVGEVSRGNFALQFNLREGDEIRPIAQGLNEMVIFLRDEINKLKNGISELERAAESSGSSQEVKEKIRRLKSEMEKFRS